MKYKGIILAGGAGTRLYPLTLVTSKQLLPVYDKPLVFYPLATLMQAGIREILIITNRESINSYKFLFGNGNQLGLNIEYVIQDNPDGIAQSIILGHEFIKDSCVSLILGDNIFHGDSISRSLNNAAMNRNGATIFCTHVNDPERFGVVEFNNEGEVKSIIEKPHSPKSNYVATGIYFYDENAYEITKSLKPSDRGELEITDLNNAYLKLNKLKAEKFDSDLTWFDTGTHESLIDAANYVLNIDKRQGLKVACVEEIAFKRGWIGLKEIEDAYIKYSKSSYGAYLNKILKDL